MYLIGKSSIIYVDVIQKGAFDQFDCVKLIIAIKEITKFVCVFFFKPVVERKCYLHGIKFVLTSFSGIN